MAGKWVDSVSSLLKGKPFPASAPTGSSKLDLEPQEALDSDEMEFDEEWAVPSSEKDSSIPIEEIDETADMTTYQDNSEVNDMTLDLDSLQKGLKSKLTRLEKERTAIEERLSAVALVIKTSQEMGEWEDLGEEDAEAELETDSGVEEKKASAKKSSEEAQKNDEEGDQPKREKPTFELSEEDAILEILKTFQRPLDAKSIVNELSAVGYPFENGNPVDSIDGALKDLAKDGKVSKMKGNLFAIV